MLTISILLITLLVELGLSVFLPKGSTRGKKQRNIPLQPKGKDWGTARHY